MLLFSCCVIQGLILLPDSISCCTEFQSFYMFRCSYNFGCLFTVWTQLYLDASCDHSPFGLFTHAMSFQACYHWFDQGLRMCRISPSPSTSQTTLHFYSVFMRFQQPTWNFWLWWPQHSYGVNRLGIRDPPFGLWILKLSPFLVLSRRPPYLFLCRRHDYQMSLSLILHQLLEFSASEG